MLAFTFLWLLNTALPMFDTSTTLGACYNTMNTLELIHLSLKASHYIQDLKAKNQKIWFCFLPYLLISYNHYFLLS